MKLIKKGLAIFSILIVTILASCTFPSTTSQVEPNDSIPTQTATVVKFLGALNGEVISSTELSTNTIEINGVIVILDNGDSIEAFLPQGMLDVITKGIRVRVVPEAKHDFEWSIAEILPDGEPTPDVTQTAEALLGDCALKGAFPDNGIWDSEMLTTLADKLADESGCEVEILLISPDALNLVFVTEHADFTLVSFSEFLDLQVYQPSTPLLIPSYYTSSGFYRGAIIAPLDSPAQKLKDLKRKSFAYYGKDDMYSYLMPRIMLSDGGYNPNTFFSETILVGSSTLAMINTIIEGEADAGVVWEIEEANALDWAEGDIPDVHEQVKIIDHTYWVPSNIIAVRSSLPDVLQTALQDAFLKTIESDSGKELFYYLSEIIELNKPDERTWYAVDAIPRAKALEDEIGGWQEEPEE